MSLRTRLVCRFMRATMHRNFVTEAKGVETLALPKTSGEPPAGLRRQHAITRRTVSGFEVHRVLPRSAEQSPPCVIVYLHGGSYVKEIAKQHWRLVAEIAEATGCPVDVPLYGLAPQHDLPEAVDFVVETVRSSGAARVQLVGDSAGGGLALLVAQRLRDDGAADARTPETVGVTVMAPWLDLTMSNPAIDAIEAVDPWLARPAMRPIARAVAGGLELADPRVSPLRGDLFGLPPVTVFVGTRDMTLADVRLLRDRIVAADGMIVLHESLGSPHVHPLLPTPEGRLARRQLIETVVAHT